MKISEIYETALFLAEKTDDYSGFTDPEYKKIHQNRGLELIKQAAYKLSNTENIKVLEIGRLSFESEINIPYHIGKFIIPLYVAAILCKQDGEDDKYNILIYEYENSINHIKHEEESIFEPSLLEGLR